jgi:hypothetical protein
MHREIGVEDRLTGNRDGIDDFLNYLRIALE